MTEIVDRPSPRPSIPPDPITLVRPLSRLTRVKAKGLSGSEILEAARKEVDWVWEPSIVSGTTVTIGGPPTCGKSTLLFLFLVARMSEVPITLLGRRVKPANPNQYTVVVEEQNGRGASRKLLRAIASLKLDPEKILERFILLARDPVIVGDGTWRDVVGLTGEGLVSDIAIDTLANTTKEEANDEQEQIILYRQFRTALNAAPRDMASRPVLWIICHTRKGEDSDVTAKDLAGHHQRVAQTDTLLMLEVVRDKNKQQMAARCHFAKERDNLDGHSAPILFDATGATKRTVQDRVLDELTIDGEHTAKSLSETLGVRHETVETALAALLKRGVAKGVKGVKRGGQCQIYRRTVPDTKNGNGSWERFP